MIKNRPNVFQFATHELSQDAILLYFADCYNCEDTKVIGEEFLKQFGCSTEGLKTVYPIKQYNKIDVLIVLDYNDYYDLLTIEDKTFTSEHDNQLLRYKKIIDDLSYFSYEKLGIENKRVNNKIYVYFKPLIYNDNEMLVIKNSGYKIKKYEDLQRVLDIKCSDIIFNEYKEYYNWAHEKELHYKVARLEDLKEFSIDEIMSSYIGQWTLAKLLLSESDKSFKVGRMYQGSSYGRPWTQYRFVFDKSCKNEDWYNINLNEEVRGEYTYFYRLDYDKQGYYMACRQYIYDKAMAIGVGKSEEAVDIMSKLSAAEITHVKRGKGKKETTIWIYYFESIEDLIRIKDEIAKVQEIVINSVLGK